MFLFSTIAHAQEIPAVAVATDDTLALPIAEIARAYTRKYQITVSTAFLPKQVEESVLENEAYTDVLITSQNTRIETLKNRGVVDIYSDVSIAHNRLGLVGPLNSPLEINLARGFPVAGIVNALAGEQLFVIGNPEFLEEGTSAREAMQRMEVAADMEPYTLYVKELSQMVRLVVGQGAYGIMYQSDAIRLPQLKILALFPESTHTPISYRAIVLAGENMNNAREFLKFLQTPTARNIFKKYGFE